MHNTLKQVFGFGNPNEEQLVVAAKRGDLKRVRGLVARGANVNFKDKDDATPLIYASKYGHLSIVKELLAHGADVMLADKTNCTPLHIASYKGHLIIVQVLLAHGASVDATDENGKTPLNWASSWGHIAIVKELLAHGAPINSADKQGNTPLHCASANRHLDIVNELQAQGAAIEAANANGYTPLRHAAFCGYLDVFKKLITCDADIHAKNKKDADTPLHVAAWNGHFHIVEELMTHGIHLTPQTSLVTLHCIEHQGMDKPRCKHCNYKNGSTPLHHAACKGHVDVVKVLLAHGAPIDARNSNGDTALHWASMNGQVYFDQELDTTATNKSRKVPCPPATFNGQVQVLKVLLDAGANRHLRNEDGKTARDLGNSAVDAWFDIYRNIANKTLLEIISKIPTKRFQTHVAP
ncbi:hypothetical protein AeMF1_009691 [Aphanomyces euteiches]|nr:hypothetical protein AeMF1_009691 [Aphanomyces euteiches]KAH9196955.1 hypothetical protein AeNC1_001076 [Aphanomyces euteiches]